MKKRAFACLLVLGFMIIPTMALAEEPEDWGGFVVDGGDYRVYRVYEDTESMDAENVALNGSSKSRIKGLFTYAQDGSGMPRPSVTLGTSMNLVCHFYVFKAGEVRVFLNIKGPNGYRERLATDPLSGEAGIWTVVVFGGIFPSPGFYTFKWTIKSKGKARLKGRVHVLPPPES
jgi:hypothetical protein